MDSLLDADTVYDREELLRMCRFYLYDQLKVLESAVDIVDGPFVSGGVTSKVRCCHSHSGARSFWMVPGSRGAEYTCVSGGCTCQSYLEMSKSAGVNVEVMCKHLIAIRLATALDMVAHETLSDESFVTQLSSKISSSCQGVDSLLTSASNRSPHFQPY